MSIHKRSKYDQFFKVVGDFHECRLCAKNIRKQIDSGTNSMRHHLKLDHSAEFAEFDKQQKERKESRLAASKDPALRKLKLHLKRSPEPCQTSFPPKLLKQDQPLASTSGDTVANFFAAYGLPFPAAESSVSETTSMTMSEDNNLQESMNSLIPMLTEFPIMSLPLTFQATDLPCQTVTVYNDRAEVKRELKVNLAAGIHELVIENISPAIERNSINLEGTGNAVIHEVKFKSELKDRPPNFQPIDSPEIELLIADGTRLEDEQKAVEDMQIPYRKQLEALNAMLATFSVAGKDKPIVDSYEFERNIKDFFGLYEEKTISLQKEIRREEKKSAALQKQMDAISAKIVHLRSKEKKCPMVNKKILVTVEAVEEGDVEFTLTYQVSNARWRPSYDLRLVSGDTSKLRIDFSAQIKQTTGEDWSDAKILLSTATPCLGGTVPELGTLHASFVQPSPPRGMFGGQPLPPSNGPAPCLFGTAVATATSFGGTSSGGSGVPPPAPEVTHAEMSANYNGFSMEFEVPNLKTIPSDDAEHKMLVKSLTFEPSLLHECVPKKSTNVFLTASVVNNSEFPLIEGDAAVYLNHSFVAKTHLKAVAPGEKFTCSLGVDNAVKVTYKAPHKFNTESGIFNKASNVANTQTITVHNTKRTEPVTIVLRDHIPKATDERIKVKVIEPTIQTADPAKESRGVRVGSILNSDNNLEWTAQIKAGEKKELNIKWQIEFPSNEQIEYKELRNDTSRSSFTYFTR
ncbi:hypothetical protein QR680_007150 [Steinernema hermaphroditum]|uniref:BED-type domain-containing protein n=1 Tax=Steinernema hermaphroditum TaxID=289476 RepID=A0AA39LYB9_9BILA|nr:hypothetical protein QR680_007150 [Steinernema hermaphroditum]